MAWPATTASAVLSGEGAENIGQDLFDRDIEVSRRRCTWAVSTAANMTTTLADVFTADVRIPSYALTGAELKLRFRAMRDAAVSGTANFRLRETGVPTNGTTLATTITTAWVVYEVDGLSVPDDTWAGTVKTLALQAQRPASGTDNDWDIDLRNVVLNLVFEAV